MIATDLIALGALIVAAYGAVVATVVAFLQIRQHRQHQPRLDVRFTEGATAEYDYEKEQLGPSELTLRVEIVNPGPRPVQINGGLLLLSHGQAMDLSPLPTGRPLLEAQSWPVEYRRSALQGQLARDYRPGTYVVGAWVSATNGGPWRAKAPAQWRHFLNGDRAHDDVSPDRA